MDYVYGVSAELGHIKIKFCTGWKEVDRDLLVKVAFKTAELVAEYPASAGEWEPHFEGFEPVQTIMVWRGITDAQWIAEIEGKEIPVTVRL